MSHEFLYLFCEKDRSPLFGEKGNIYKKGAKKKMKKCEAENGHCPPGCKIRNLVEKGEKV